MNSKKNWAKVIALALAVLMIVGVVPTVAAAKADAQPKAAGWQFRLVAEGKPAYNPAYASGTALLNVKVQAKDASNPWSDDVKLFDATLANYRVVFASGPDKLAINSALAWSTNSLVFDLKALKAGVAEVQVQYSEDSTATNPVWVTSETLKVYVNQEPGLSLESGANTVLADSTNALKVVPSVAQADFASHFDVAYTISSGSSIAEITADNKLKIAAGVAAGIDIKVLATATNKNYDTYKAASETTFTVTGKAPAAEAVVNFAATTAGANNIIVNGEIGTISATIKTSDVPSYAASTANGKVFWTTSDASIVTVNGAASATVTNTVTTGWNGLCGATLKALKAGKVTITGVITDTGVPAKTITQEIEVLDATIDPSADQNIFLGDSFTITPKVTIGGVVPTSGVTITFSSSNSDYVAVDSQGVVTGKTNNPATITVKFVVVVGTGDKTTPITITKAIKVDVSNVSGKLSVSPNALSLLVGATATSTPALTISGVTMNPNLVSWKSDDTAIATVEKNESTGVGTIKGIATGTTTVNAQYTSGSVTIKAAVKVVVTDTKIEFAKDFNRYMAKNDKLEDVKVNVTKPAGASPASLTWTSSKPEIATIAPSAADPSVGILTSGKESGWTKITVKDEISGVTVESKYFYVISKYFKGAKSTLAEDKEMTVEAIFYPLFLGSKGEWSVNNEDRLEIVSSSLADTTAKTNGKATVKCLKDTGSVWLFFQSSALSLARISLNINK